MLRATRLGLVLVLAMALALLAGCAGAGANKAGGQGPRKTVVLTLANFFPDAQEVGGFAANVARLSHGSLRIDLEGAGFPRNPGLRQSAASKSHVAGRLLSVERASVPVTAVVPGEENAEESRARALLALARLKVHG